MHLVSRSKYQDNGKDKWVVRQLLVLLLEKSILYSIWNGHYEYEQFIQELLNANKQQATLQKRFK
jgi:hypothetical protein